MHQKMFPRGPWKGDLIEPWPVPEMVLAGARFRHGRIAAGLSQRRLAAISGVSQSRISRFERGLVTGMAVERIVAVAASIGPHFPFGFCPHNHRCEWPYGPRDRPAFAGLLDD